MACSKMLLLTKKTLVDLAGLVAKFILNFRFYVMFGDQQVVIWCFYIFLVHILTLLLTK